MIFTLILTHFSKKKLLFFKNHDLRQLKLTFKNQSDIRGKSVKRIKNDNCQFEKFFLSYMDIMDTMIFKTVQKLNLNTKEQGRKDIKKKRMECRKIIWSKLTGSLNIYGNVKHRTIRMAETELTSDRNITNYDSGTDEEFEYYEDYVDNFYKSSAEDNSKETTNNLENQKTYENTSEFFKTTTSLESLHNNTDNNTFAIYDTNNVTDTTSLITKNNTRSITKDIRADSSNFLIALLITIVGLGVVTCFVGAITSVFCYFKNSNKKKKKQDITAESINLFDVRSEE